MTANAERQIGDSVLDVEGLRMRYGVRDVLDDVTFQANRGQIVALLGPNGAGKTTTIEILKGFRMRSSGQVSVLGSDPARGGEDWRSRVGIVLQSWRDHPKWRVRELLAYQGAYYAPYSQGLVERPWDPDDLMAAVGLTAQANTQLRMLSGGQRRRMDVAIGLVGRPELLFLDETTAGLDPAARRDFHDLIRQVTERYNTTILITTHDLDEADKLADRIVILVSGHIIADGTTTELARKIAGHDEVHWTLHDHHHRESVRDSTGFVRNLFARHGAAIGDLEVHRASLEDTYLSLVRQAEQHPTTRLEDQEIEPKGEAR